jgi:hypothetical protein
MGLWLSFTAKPMNLRPLFGCLVAWCLASPGFCATPPSRPQSSGWTHLFDGRTLAGWKAHCLPADAEKEFWTVRDGAIVCDSIGRKDHHYVWLMHESEWDDFELELEFQAFRSSPGNSGVQFRSRYDTSATAPNGGWLDGPQIDIHPPAPFRTGLIYDETRTEKRWIFPSLPSSKMEPRPTPAGFVFHYAEDGNAWNHLRIVARGTSITSVLNGVTMAHYDGTGVLDNPGHRLLDVGLRGRIALQLHVRDELKIAYRTIRVRALPAR